MRFKWFVFFLVLCGSGLFAEPVTDGELRRLQFFEVNQSVSFESYTQTNLGVANVFGYHFDTFLTPNWFVGLGIFGAVGGERGGYGIASFGSGYRMAIGKGYVDARLLLGSGGGGGIPAGGGFSVQPGVGVYYPVSKTNLLGFVRGGYLWFPSGTFESPTVAIGVLYRYNVPFLSFK